jgi:hypothetical protein
LALVGAMISGIGIIANSPFIQNTQYNILKLLGHGTFDKIIIKNYAMTIAELDALTPVNYSWDNTMELYAEFNDNLQGGSLQTAGTVTSWNLFRYPIGETYPDYQVLDISGDTTSLVDYTAIKDKTYYYKIYPITSTAVVSALQSNNVTPLYNGWVLLDPITGEAFSFDLNVESSELMINDDVTDYVGHCKYPAPSKGLRSYLSFTLNAYLGYMDGTEYIDTIALYNQLNNFVTNGNQKFCKDRTGHIWKVDTRHPKAKIQDVIESQPKVVSFDIVQVGDV